MRTGSAKELGRGARFAACPRRLLAARLLAILLVLFLALPVAEAAQGHPPAHTSAGHFIVGGLSLEEPSLQDEGVGHYCPQCACHQMLAIELASLPDTDGISGTHFPIVARATWARVKAPPHKPPRA